MTRKAAASYFKDKFFHLLITILIAIIGFIGREYLHLNKQIFDQLMEKSEAQDKKYENLKENQLSDHLQIQQNSVSIDQIKDCNEKQDKILQLHELEIDRLKSK